MRWLIALFLLGLLVRSGRWEWQPFWWDEGYSIYFASEPLGRMFQLTAHDIHPPLYYALLHLWISLLQSVQPAALRLFSVLVGMGGLALFLVLARLLFPHRPRITVIAGLLLASNPMHLYYSQEVRMYGLALALGIASAASIWRLAICCEQGKALRATLLAYAVSTALALYTLYYTALLIAAQALWFIWRFRRHPAAWRILLAAYLAALAVYLPWLVYALPKLAIYVSDKVPADADQPLGPLAYLLRHWLAFTAGHVVPQNELLLALYWVGAIVAGLLLGVSLFSAAPRGASQATPADRQPSTLLWASLLLPFLMGFALNRWVPFFPQGGERLLLIVLPYFLLLLAQAVADAWASPYWGRMALAGLLLCASAGVWVFYTTPRHTEHDYRPLIRQIVQQGNDDGTVLAIFPWEVGYWRTYAAAEACKLESEFCAAQRGLEPQHGPVMVLVADGPVAWGPIVRNAIDRALDRGVLWFAAPLAFGSTLPGEIEGYLAGHAVNLENRWANDATRLSAWQRFEQPRLANQEIDFGPVQLASAGFAPWAATSANQPVHVALAWQFQGRPENLGATLRLQDQTGRVWASRNYTPLGSLTGANSSAPYIDRVGLIVPTGLPPARYELMLGVVVSETQALLAPASQESAPAPLVSLGWLDVIQPDPAPPAFRLPLQRILRKPLPAADFHLLGYAGNTVDATLLAGEAIDLTLFLQAQPPVAPGIQLRTVLLNEQDEVMVEGGSWSPEAWPVDRLARGDLVQAPIHFFTPATLPGGAYHIGLEVLEPERTSAPRQPAIIDQAHFRQRFLQVSPPRMATPLTPPVQFGTHALLLGYDLTLENGTLALALHWQVLQTLLPPHHIFVHLNTADGSLLAQSDDIPTTAGGPAPSGTWRPNEYLTTHHQLAAPQPLDGAMLYIGLYLPETGVRLPASRDGQPIGDTAMLSLVQ